MKTPAPLPLPLSPPQRVLVVGGAGFIGSHFVDLLLASRPDREVLTLDLLTRVASLNNLRRAQASGRHTFVRGDATDPALVRRLIAEFSPQAVVNLAAQSHVDRSISNPLETVQSNVMTAATLLEESRRADVRRYLQVSTDEVYGPWLEGQPWADEDAPLRPTSPYAASKAAADLFVSAARRTYGYPALNTRGCNTYGPRQYPEKLIPLGLEKLLAGQPVPLYGTGLQERVWLHVSDHCRGILAVLERGRPAGTYNLGSGTVQTNRELVQRLAALAGWAGASEPWCTVADRPGHDRTYRIDDARVRGELGWAPQVALAEGLAETVRWYREHPGWWTAEEDRLDALVPGRDDQRQVG